MTAILPSDPPNPPPWTPLHDRLHRELLQRPQLLPAGERLLVAVSGGQDSMALVGLLADLRRLHGWELRIWHGDHGWRPESADQAQALADWAGVAGLELVRNRSDGGSCSEAEARTWRYDHLTHWASELGCSRVVTGHTANDRAETLLLHLARGAHLRGLSSLRRCRPLRDSILLVRPLLGFSRTETAAFCHQAGLPVWQDPSNNSMAHARNRIRHQVLPVLEALHPGAARRLAALSERLEEEGKPLQELLPLALATLTTAGSDGTGLDRRKLVALSPASQGHVVAHWLGQRAELTLSSQQLTDLLRRLHPGQGPGSLDLKWGWRLSWDRREIRLQPPLSGQRPPMRPPHPTEPSPKPPKD